MDHPEKKKKSFPNDCPLKNNLRRNLRRSGSIEIIAPCGSNGADGQERIFAKFWWTLVGGGGTTLSRN